VLPFTLLSGMCLKGRTEYKKRLRKACVSVRVSNWVCLAQNSMSMRSEHRMSRSITNSCHSCIVEEMLKNFIPVNHITALNIFDVQVTVHREKFLQ